MRSEFAPAIHFTSRILCDVLRCWSCSFCVVEIGLLHELEEESYWVIRCGRWRQYANQCLYVLVPLIVINTLVIVYELVLG